MPPKHVPPAITLKSFNCPVCGAFADQNWFEVGATSVSELPTIFSAARIEELAQDENFLPNNTEDQKRDFLSEFKRLASGDVFFTELDALKQYWKQLSNLHVSCCYSCKNVALWKHDTLLFPREKYIVEPNADLNEDIRHDFDEAREVLDISPRSAAALLRLCVQKICIQLGFPGKNINDDIGTMVQNGLNTKIQKSLDIVRVIGNEAVHPGTMDLGDNRETAIKLFDVVNRIAYDMISHPKEIQALYETLPPEKLAAITKRDT